MGPRVSCHRGGISPSIAVHGPLTVLLLLVSLLLLAACGSTTSTALPVLTPACAWPGAVNALTLSENPQLNVSNPDSAAAYWLMPLTVEDGLRVTLSGQYPDSRYMSFALYDAQGSAFTTNGVSSTLTDDRITPGPGSINPWQQPAPPGGRFTVTLRSDVAPGQVNTLPLAPSGTAPGTTDVLFYRVYVPTHGDPGQVPLPTITLTRNGVSHHLPACPTSSQAVLPTTYCAIPWVAKESPVCQANGHLTSSGPSAAPGTIAPFARHAMGAGGTPDNDFGYLSARIGPPPNGEVVIIHAKAPTTPSGSAPSPWPAPGVDVRYWSLCLDLATFPIPVVANPLPDGTVDYGCRYDRQVTLDQDGYYTFVIGTQAQRTAIERIPGATFLPLSATATPTQAYNLNLRHLLANPAFTEAIQDVPADGRFESAADVMGAYYPRIAFCSLATLATSGATACLAAAPLPSGHAGGLSLPGGFTIPYATLIVVAGVVGAGVMVVVVVTLLLRARRPHRRPHNAKMAAR